MELPNELFTLETLAAFPGLVVATWTIVQFTKNGIDWAVKRFLGLHWSTRGWAYCVALFLLVATTFFSGNFSLLTLFLSIINGFFVALAAMKVHESAAFDKPKNTNSQDVNMV